MGTQLFPIKLSIKEIYKSVDWCQLPHQIVLEHVVIFLIKNMLFVLSSIPFIIVLIRRILKCFYSFLTEYFIRYIAYRT